MAQDKLVYEVNRAPYQTCCYGRFCLPCALRPPDVTSYWLEGFHFCDGPVCLFSKGRVFLCVFLVGVEVKKCLQANKRPSSALSTRCVQVLDNFTSQTSHESAFGGEWDFLEISTFSKQMWPIISPILILYYCGPKLKILYPVILSRPPVVRVAALNVWVNRNS